MTVHTAFLTGCATGFGHRLAARLLSLGHKVVATDKTVAHWPERLGAPRDRLLVLPCDVRDPAQVKQAAADAVAWSPVDVLVNNAGYAIFGTQEETRLDLVEEMFDVNVFGAARVTQALLPSLRATGGQVIQLSSVAGRTAFPESGFYAATKYALEAMSEALFQEACTYGVRVRLMEPGSFDTQFLPTAQRLSPKPDPASPYHHLRDLWNDRKFSVLEPPQDPEQVVDAVVGALDDPAPFRRIPVGPDSQRILSLRDALGPDRWAMLAAARNGLPEAESHDDLPAPEAFLADQARNAPVPDALIAAWEHGHLDHWEQSEVGKRALAALSQAATP